MCAKQSLRKPVRTDTPLTGATPRLTPGNTIRSGYHSWRLSPRGSNRSPVRNDAGRNALSGVKVSSPVNQSVPEWPSVYEVSDAVMASAAKATPEANHAEGTPGVQVHGMYRRLTQELGRSPSAVTRKKSNCPQGVMSKWSVLLRREVRWFRSSEEVG
jgi:hypothetical protein